MRFRKKILMSLIVVLLMLLSLACGKKEDTESGGKNESVTETQEENNQTKERNNKREKKNNRESVSSKPHILLEKVNKYMYDNGESGYMYELQDNRLVLKEDSKEFEPLISAFEKYNEEVDERIASEQSTLEELGVEIGQDTIANGLDAQMIYSNSRAYIMRADEIAVSVLNYVEYDYTGSYPRYSYSSRNFDTVTGETIDFTDVVKDDKTFFELVDTKADEFYPESDFSTTSSEYAEELKENEYRDLVWTLNPNGVTVYFATGTLGSYTDGPQLVTVYFDDNEELFDSKYIGKDEDYVMPIVNHNMIMDLDIYGSGSKEKVSVGEKYAQDPDTLKEYVEGMEVYVGDEKIAEFEAYEGENYIIKKDDKYYTYSMVKMYDSDYIYRLDLSTGEFNSENDEIYLGLATKGYDDYEEAGGVAVYTNLSETFTDLDSVFLEETGYVLSTSYIESEWKIDEDAYPVSDDERGRVTNNIVIYTKDEVSAKEVDTKGKVKKDTVIPEGSYLLFMYSDGNDFVDVRIIDEKDVDVGTYDGTEVRYFNLKDDSLKDYDGICYRITVDRDDEYFSTTVDGVPIEELFEGMTFAG